MTPINMVDIPQDEVDDMIIKYYYVPSPKVSQLRGIVVPGLEMKEAIAKAAGIIPEHAIYLSDYHVLDVATLPEEF